MFVYFERIKDEEISIEEQIRYANSFIYVTNELILRGEKPSFAQVRDYAACLETFGFIPLNYEELEDFLLEIQKTKPEKFEEYIKNAFRIDYSSYKLAGGVGKKEEISDGFKVTLPPRSPEKKISKWKLALGIGALLGAIGAGYYFYNNKHENKNHEISLNNTFKNNKPVNKQQNNKLSEIEKYGLKKGVSLTITKTLENSIKNTDAKLLIDYLANFSKHNYIPSSVKDITPEEYQQEVYDNIISKIAAEVIKDGKFSENEKRALNLLNELGNETIKWYIFEKNFDEKTLNYLAYLSSLHNKTLAKYAASNLLFFEDKKLDEDEEEFLKNPNNNKLLEKIKQKYTKLLEKIPGLEKQIKNLPEYKENNLQSIEALEDIAFLANRSESYEKFEDRFNPEKISKSHEVYEAFELMLNGGIPDKKDFNYQVPDYNTELQCLWWLAEENEFKNYDTLAQAIAMDHGLFVTMGTEEVKKAVKKDINEFLKFGRETSEWQKAMHLDYNLEDYPLEAKIFWADRAGSSLLYGSYNIFYKDTLRGKTENFRNTNFPLKGYEWDTVSIETLEEMRKEFIGEFLSYKGDMKKFTAFLIGYYTDFGHHWIYTSGKNLEKYAKMPVKIDNRKTILIDYGNVDWNWKHYKETGKGIGVCVEKAEFISNVLKAYGISSPEIYFVGFDNNKRMGHTEFLVFNNNDKFEKFFQYQAPIKWDLYGIYLPPIDQKKYLKINCAPPGKLYHTSDKACCVYKIPYNSNLTPPIIDKIDMKKIIYRIK